MPHISVKLGLETKIAKYQREHTYAPHEDRLVLQLDVDQLIQESMFHLTGLTGEMRQIDEYKQDGTYQEEGTEQAQVSEGYRLQGYQSQKGSHRGDVAHQ